MGAVTQNPHGREAVLAAALLSCEALSLRVSAAPSAGPSAGIPAPLTVGFMAFLCICIISSREEGLHIPHGAHVLWGTGNNTGHAVEVQGAHFSDS